MYFLCIYFWLAGSFADVHRLSLHSLAGVHRLLVAMASLGVKHMCFTQFFKIVKKMHKIQSNWLPLAQEGTTEY